MPPVEIELKLNVPPQAAAAIARLPEIAAFKRGRAATKTLISTYYDAPDFRLFKTGITVRLRGDGGNRILTVKTKGDRSGGLFSRNEWEWRVDADAIPPDLLIQTGLPELGASDLVETLRPVMTTKVRRKSILLSGPDWSVEMAVDQGAVAAGETRSDISEIEFELKSGETQRLFDLAEAVALRLPCRVGAQSKSERGFAAAMGEEARPSKARPAPLDAGMSAEQAFRAVARNCMAHLQMNEAALYGPHGPEAIHQMRVALRRFRSALKVFKPILAPGSAETVKAQLRDLLNHLGPARDADVFMADIIAPVIAAHGDDPALIRLRDEWGRQRDADFAAARRAVESADFTLLQVRVGRWIESADWVADPARALPVGAFARKALGRSFAKLLKAGGKKLNRLPAHDLHQVRILGKQMRYAAEFFGALYPQSAVRPFIALLTELQDGLGSLNDLSVAAQRLARRRHESDLAWAAGLIGGRHEIRLPQLLADSDAAWKRLRAARPFWERKS